LLIFQREFAILSARAQFEKGVELFNSRNFFECHDTIEELWMEWRENDRSFFQGLIQVAVGFYHLENRNYKGARSQLSKGLAKLQQYQPAHFGVEVESFVIETAKCLRWVEDQEPGSGARQFDERMLPTLRWLK
jgi:uncharacterized protein